MRFGSALVLMTTALAQTAPPEQSLDRPSACAGGAMAFDRARSRLVLFDGGSPDCGFERQITWEHDGQAWTKVLEADGPSPRHFHAMAFDEARGVVVLYGGVCDAGALICDDAWVWDGDGWQAISTEGPGARYGSVLTYDVDRQVILLYGGVDGRGTRRDLWSWDGVAWSLEWSGE